MRRWGLPILGLVLVGLTVGFVVGRGEALLATGEPVFLELVPVDPRAPLLGDYMALRYRVAQEAGRAAADAPRRGLLVITLDDRGRATFSRFLKVPLADATLQPNERVLAYRRNDSDIVVSSPAWFIPEGEGHAYSDAKYGEIRLKPDGSSLLVGLRGPTLEPLGTPRPTWQR